MTRIALTILIYAAVTLPALADRIPCEFGTDHPCDVPEPSGLAVLAVALLAMWGAARIGRMLRHLNNGMMGIKAL